MNTHKPVRVFFGKPPKQVVFPDGYIGEMVATSIGYKLFLQKKETHDLSITPEARVCEITHYYNTNGEEVARNEFDSDWQAISFLEAGLSAADVARGPQKSCIIGPTNKKVQ